MALTGIQIQKLLPGTNCKECGSNTCLAFAMRLAGRKAELSECPYASDEAKRVLGEASEPPVRVIELGPEKKLKIGGETVLYRHEKTFVNPTAIAIAIDCSKPDDEIANEIDQIAQYRFERVGEVFKIDMIAIVHTKGPSKRLAEAAELALKLSGLPLILKSSDASALAGAAKNIAGSNSVICAPHNSSASDAVTAAIENRHAAALLCEDFDALVLKTSALRDSGFSNIIIDFNPESLAEEFQTNTIARRSAVLDSMRPVGYPTIRWISSDNELEDSVTAATEILKYGGIIVLHSFDPAFIAPLFTLRLNIYTDPQKPIQVEPRLYPIGEPNENSPVFVTTNFSLTYFVVSGEIENSGLSSWLLVPECEGMSVLTAWSAGKFNAQVISKYAKEFGLENMVKSRDLIIPGYVSHISGELEDTMPGWKVIIGPQEASDIESFVRAKNFI
jgi:acetyl-CoA decarbonylase/synthase complex subunit gamma